MSPEVVALIATLSGVVIGGLMNLLSTRSTKTHEWKLALRRDQANTRQRVYSEFLSQCELLVLMRRAGDSESLAEQSPVRTKFAEVSLVAPEHVVAIAKKLMEHAVVADRNPPAKEATTLKELQAEFTLSARTDINSLLS